jgi:putative ABC transport system permease protein
VKGLVDLALDLRYAARMLRRAPGFTAVAVLSLGIGIGANTAIFSIVDALMLRPLPVEQPSQLVIVRTTQSDMIQYAAFESVRDAAIDLADLSAVVRTDRYNVVAGRSASAPAGVDAGPVRAALVSGTYFSTVRAGAAIGRTLAAADDRLAAQPVAVISDEYWSRRFNRSADVVGRTLTFGDTACAIVGVAARGFGGEWIGRPADVWIPIVRQPQIMVEIPVGGIQNVPVVVVGRLRGAVGAGQAAAAMQGAFERVQREQAGANATARQLQLIASERVEVRSGARGYSPQRESFAVSLGVLMAAVGFVLLVACANVANLLLARSEARRREMAIRLAVGAGRARIVRQLLAESLLLGAAGGVVGVIVAQWATDALVAFVRSGPATNAAATLTMDLDVHQDLRILLFMGGLCVATGVLCGLVPAFRGSRAPLTSALVGRGAASDISGRGRFAIGKLLVVGQVALSLVLVIGAGLLARTLWNLTSQATGFDRDRLLLVWALPGQTGGRGAGAADFWKRAMERVANVPGVVVVSASNQGVLNGSDLSNIGSGPPLRIDGEPPAAGGLPGLRSFVAPGFFRTMGIAMVAGRDFTEQDTATAPRGVVISESMARHYFGNREAIGRRIWFPEDTTTPTTVIGVAKDILIGTPRESMRRPGFTYFSYRDREAPRRLRTMMMAVRTAADPAALAAAIRREMSDPALQLPVMKIDTVNEQLSDVLVQERLVSTLSSAFGALSLVLACLGLYGVVSYAVARRTNEIGIRMALGATRSEVLAAVLRESLGLVAVGIAIGAPATLASTRAIASRLFGIGSADPVTIGMAAGLLVAAATMAAVVPARRAARVDPMIALRAE